MVQPAWDQNTWGYDDVQSPYRQGPIYAENDLTLLDKPGEWYQDVTAGALYYIPLSGQDMTKVDVELPQLQLLVAIGAACPSAVAAGGECVPLDGQRSDEGRRLRAAGGRRPVCPAGARHRVQRPHVFAHQLARTEHRRTCRPADRRLPGRPSRRTTRAAGRRRRSRPRGRTGSQIPAAVQVSAAKNISFVRDRFVALGQVGLGIGNDADAHMSGVGLGANGVSVTGCVFTQIAGGAVVIGGAQAWAHHPCGDKVCGASDPGSKLINQNITLKDNLVHDIGIDYRDFAGLMFTYTQNVVVTHNEVYNVPYSGIASGFGWGVNDAGGNNDYKSRPTGNLYKYQPLFATGDGRHEQHDLRQLRPPDAASDERRRVPLQPVGEPRDDGHAELLRGQRLGAVGHIWGEYEDEGSAYLTDHEERLRELRGVRHRQRERHQQHGPPHLHEQLGSPRARGSTGRATPSPATWDQRRQFPRRCPGHRQRGRPGSRVRRSEDQSLMPQRCLSPGCYPSVGALMATGG